MLTTTAACYLLFMLTTAAACYLLFMLTTAAACYLLFMLTAAAACYLLFMLTAASSDDVVAFGRPHDNFHLEDSHVIPGLIHKTQVIKRIEPTL